MFITGNRQTTIREKLLPENGGLVSIVGAGGKTSLMFRLAKELSEAGESVLTTTTTKIFMPTAGQSEHIVVSADLEDALGKAGELMKISSHVTIGKQHLASGKKLGGFNPDTVRKFWESGLFRWIIVEADGAAQRPLKAPAAHEPVIPDCSTHVVAVIGLDAVGQTLEEKQVFRSEVYSQITGVSLGSPVTEHSVAEIISNDKGLMKGSPSAAKRCVFLNKADNKNTRLIGRRVASTLREESRVNLNKILIGSIRKAA